MPGVRWAGRLGRVLLALLGWLLLWSALAGSLGGSAARAADGAGRHVVVAPIEGMIDLGLGPFVDRVLREAEQERAAAVIFEINTFGGRVDAATVIRDHLLGAQVPTVAFVNPRAISAGALITLAAERVAMAPGGTIGAATPVQMSGEETRPVDEKTVSYVRKEFRSTADARGRPGELAEAMVDSDVEVEGVIEKGKLLTLTTTDALRLGVADLEATSRADLLQKLDLAGAEVREASINWAEHVVRFLTHPVVASLLMTVGLLGLLVELRTPGVGVPGAVGALSLAAFFWGHSLVALVGWEQVILIAIGVALLAVEVFLLPGFGIAGAVGLAALLAGLATSLIGGGPSWNAIITAVSRVAFSGVAAVLVSLLVLRFLPHLPGGRKLVLSTALAEGGSLSERPEEKSLVGLLGVTLTPLRPAGIADVGGKRVDVVSEGGFIGSGEDVEVVSQQGHRVVVRAQRAPGPSSA